MDKFDKFLMKIGKKQALHFVNIFEKIESLNLKLLNCKKIKWTKNKFRIRSGKYRIIFEKDNNMWILLDINTRWDIYK